MFSAQNINQSGPNPSAALSREIACTGHFRGAVDGYAAAAVFMRRIIRRGEMI